MRHVVLAGGPTHETPATSAQLAALLADDGFTTAVTEDPAELFDALRAAEDGAGDPVDLVTVNALRWRMEAERYAHLRDAHAYELAPDDSAVLDRFVRAGGGLLALHTAVICFDAEPTWHRLVGASWDWEHSSHPPLGPVSIAVTEAGRAHPVTAGLEGFTITDEVYGFLDEELGLVPLLTGTHSGRDHPLVWARPVGDGRVVTALLGHGPDSFDHPAHRRLLRQAAAWAVGASAPATTSDRSGP